MNDAVYDVIDALFETMDGGEVLGDDQGVSLVISSSAMPRSGGGASDETEDISTNLAGELPAVEGVEDALAESGGEDTSLGRGRGLAQAVAGSANTADLIQRVAGLARSAGVAQSLAQGGHGGRATPSGAVAVAETSATAFSMASATRRQSVATVETARTVDRAIERDARRYDGGFVLG